MPLRQHRPPKRLPIIDCVARVGIAQRMRHRLPHSGAVRINQRGRDGGDGQHGELRSAPPSRARSEIAERRDGGVESQRGDTDEEAAVQVRPQRHQRDREPQPRVAAIIVASKQGEQRAQQHEAEHLRAKLRLQQEPACRREQDDKLDGGRRAG
jgi:hypothetical protein